MMADSGMVPNLITGLLVVVVCLILFVWIRRDRQKHTKSIGVLENRLQSSQADLSKAEAELREATLHLSQLEAEVASLRRQVEDQNAELDETRERALEAARTKSLFVANMSHELRTPLNGILGLTRNLMDASLTPRQRSEVELIRLAGEDLMRIVNDVLDLSKLETGKVELERIPFNLPELLEGMFALLYPQAERKQISYTLCYSHLMQKRYLGDPFRIRQVAMNLLSNALKFTSSGSVTMQVEEGQRSAGYTWVKLSVEDTGIGIHPEKLKLIFDEFQQADLSTTRKYGGTGLGLSLSKHIVELLGGEITVSSDVERGSAFRVSMPLKPIMILTEDQEEAGGEPQNPLSGIQLLVQSRHTPAALTLGRVLDSFPGLETRKFEDLPELESILEEPEGASWDGIVTMASSPVFAAREGQRLLASRGVNSPLLLVLNDTAAEGDSAWWSMLRSVELAVPVLPSQVISVLMQLREAPLGPLFESAGMTAFDVYTGVSSGVAPSPPLLVAHENPIELKLLQGMATKLGLAHMSASDSRQLMSLLKQNTFRTLLVQESLLGASATALLGNNGAPSAEQAKVILIGGADGRAQAHLMASRIPFAVVPNSPRLAQIRAALRNPNS